MITEAIRSVNTEHAVYFLLTAYVETLSFVEIIPETVKALPIRDRDDVRQRVQTMRAVVHVLSPEAVVPKIEEATEVFKAASEQLRTL